MLLKKSYYIFLENKNLSDIEEFQEKIVYYLSKYVKWFFFY